MGDVGSNYFYSIIRDNHYSSTTETPSFHHLLLVSWVLRNPLHNLFYLVIDDGLDSSIDLAIFQSKIGAMESSWNDLKRMLRGRWKGTTGTKLGRNTGGSPRVELAAELLVCYIIFGSMRRTHLSRSIEWYPPISSPQCTC
jgi:hypothetical protein